MYTACQHCLVTPAQPCQLLATVEELSLDTAKAFIILPYLRMLLQPQDTLRRLPDLERGLTRALHRTAPPSEFVATLLALGKVHRATDMWQGCGSRVLSYGG
jgi:hypothetical protein